MTVVAVPQAAPIIALPPPIYNVPIVVTRPPPIAVPFPVPLPVPTAVPCGVPPCGGFPGAGFPCAAPPCGGVPVPVPVPGAGFPCAAPPCAIGYNGPDAGPSRLRVDTSTDVTVAGRDGVVNG